MAYEERLLLYADILGWRAAIGGDDGSRLLSVILDIHKYAEDHNRKRRKELKSQRRQDHSDEPGANAAWTY